MSETDVPAVRDFTPARGETVREILAGLDAAQKRLPAKLLYDARGSELFERICKLDEYYLTRAELSILEQHGAEMARAVGPACLVIEFGSGSSTKTRLLLDRLEAPAGYVPIDISRSALQESAETLAERYPDLAVLPVCADYTSSYELPRTPTPARRRLVYFPGSTIGNFQPHEIPDFLAHLAETCGPAGGALIGLDLHKDVATLEAAYDDALGVTAEFELNALEHLNREYGADFDLSRFEYLSFYNQESLRVEMYLVSLETQTVRLAGRAIRLEAGERILTEYSHKFTREGFACTAAACGMTVERVWTDEAGLFSVQYLTRE